jgi:cation transport ATPase
MLVQGKAKNIKKSARNSDHGHVPSGSAHEHHEHGHDHNHGQHQDHHHGEHGHEEHHTHHDNETPHGHQHDHEESEYDDHVQDKHSHSHDHGSMEDRAFTHVHDHGHNFFHSHHHSHHPEHTSAIHRVFGDPLRDWFAVLLMIILIGLGYFNLLPGKLADGMLLCAAVVGIFPLLKNALFESVVRRKFSIEILLGILLVGGLILGNFLQVALVSLFLLVGSFLRLDFSWKKE